MNATFFYMTDQEWPLARIVFNRNPENCEEFDQFLNACRTNLYSNNRGRFVLLVDPSGLSTMNPTYIYKIAHFMKDMEPMTKKYMIELGLIVKSSVTRAIIDLVKSLKSPAVPWKIFAQQSEVDEWIHELQDRQILFPV